MQKLSIPHKRARIYAAAYIMLATVLLLSVIRTKSASAQVGLGFGGPILMAYECACSGGWMIVVGPPNPGLYVFQFGASMLYPYGQIFRPGAWVLGTALPTGVCVPASGICLDPIPARQIIMVGTSAL